MAFVRRNAPHDAANVSQISLETGSKKFTTAGNNASNIASDNRPASIEYQFGDFRADPRRRRLWRGDKRVAITPKAFDLLLFLLSRPGQTIDKDDAVNAVWPNTAIQDGALAQMVFVLRKALDQGRTGEYIVTVPGRGYRFVADVKERPLDSGRNGNPASEVRAKPFPRLKLLSIFGALALVSVTLVLIFKAVERRPATAIPPHRAVPFTSYVGGQYEPAFSPDGTKVAFVWDGEKQDNYDIYVKPLEGGSLLRITKDAAGDGSPAWSADGRSIAFIRYSEKPGVSGVFIAPAFGGQERKVVAISPLAHIFDRYLDWSPDGKTLVYVDREADVGPVRLYAYSLATGQRRVLTSPPPASLGDTGPSISPDGRVVVFRRSASSSVNDLYRIPLQGGEPRRLTFDDSYTTSHAWTPDGRALLVASRRSGSLRLWRLSIGDGSMIHLPEIGEEANFVAVSRQGGRLAYSAWQANIDIWRMQLSSAGKKFGNASPLITSAFTDSSPQYSPDGRKIAFRSTRSGNFEVWVADQDGRNAVQLTSFRGPLTGTPRWSPDGQFVVFDSRPEGNGDIFVVGASGGSVRRITTDKADDVVPSWSRDGKWIYFSSTRTGRWQVWKVPPGGESPPSPAIQITHSFGFAPIESFDGSRVYFAKDPRSGGLWSVPAAGGEEASVIPALKPGYWSYWIPQKDGIYFLDRIEPGHCAVMFYSFQTAKSTQVGMMPKEPPYGDSGLTISTDGKSMLYPHVDHGGSNIMLVENFYP